jgi:hypothetical protein
MTININLDLIQNGLNLGQLCFLAMVDNKKSTTKSKLNEAFNLLSAEDQALLLNEYLVVEELPKCTPIYKLKPKYHKQRKASDGWYDEFYSTYPTSVVRPGHMSPTFLRKNCKKLYETIVANDEVKHRLILSQLEKEVTWRMQNGELPWMKDITSWLRQEEYTREWGDIQLIDTAYGNKLL